MRVLSAISLLLFTVSAAPVHDTDYCEQITAKCQNPCEGANSTDNKYICGDSRLGPKRLPTKMPLEDITHPYKRFGDLCPSEYLAKWTVKGSYVYPPQNGFQLDTAGNPIQGNMTLTVGTLVDRFGSEYGTFISPAYAPYTQRALPPSNLDTNPSSPEYPFNYHLYNVTKEFVVLSGPIAPWFGQPGQGVQFVTPSNIMTMINNGFLARVNLTKVDECP